jgi:mono/diheme cytochrome c family protein
MLLLVVPVVALAGCGNPWDQMFQRMIDQPKFKPYDENTHFADGRSMRQPPEGTISREQHQTALDLEKARATASGPTVGPFPLTKSLLARGRSRFEITCAACHGLLGDGQSLVARNMALRPPPDLLPLAYRSDDHFYQVITEGRGLMPSFGAELSARDRWAVVAYVRALQKSQSARLEDVPADVRQTLSKETAR